MTKPAKQTPHEKVTARIIEMMEQGVRPWSRPWGPGVAATLPRRHSGETYQGVNILALWCRATLSEYKSPFWMTFKQAKALGASVKRGEKGETVVYGSTFTTTEEDSHGNETEKTYPFLKGYNVFNADQIDGLPERFHPEPAAPAQIVARHPASEAFMAATRATIRHGGTRAFYNTGSDAVTMPAFAAFHTPEDYYSTAMHELTHWTGHKSRMDRTKGRTKRDKNYAKEELVAELGAAFLCAQLGITATIREDHASYIASWTRSGKLDPKFIISAASQASKAVAFMNELQTAQKEAA